ncbi:MAG: DUF2877 domain-containing protein [Chloroflexi bacterium]|nr:DUF2877 domain-containing protein [Chloroflexota bacterium]
MPTNFIRYFERLVIIISVATMIDTVLSASHLGEFAHQTLQQNTRGVVSGVAGRGIYLQPDHDHTLYLSWEAYKGPLTINLVGEKSLNNIKPGSPINFSPAGIEFPEKSIFIHMDKGVLWSPPSPDGEIRSVPEQIHKIYLLAKKLARENEFLPLLEMSVTGKLIPIPGIPGLDKKLEAIIKILSTSDLGWLKNPLGDLLGLGPGLTPLGDDFILGIVLTLNRWGSVLLPGYSFARLNQNILTKAREKTTRLSASLLTCAAAGSADERLILVLDTFFSPGNLREKDLQNLLLWGNSSGLAVLAGMLAVVQAYSD